jgi:hypothetical protein
VALGFIGNLCRLDMGSYDIPHLTQGRFIMYADDTLILNIRQDINELQITSDNIGVAKQYLKMNNLFINPSKTHYMLF